MNTKPNKLFPILMLLVGVLLVGFSTGRWQAPLAAWIGPVLIMRFYRDQKAGRGYWFIIIAHILAFLIGFGEMWLSSWGIGMTSGLAVLYGFLWSLPYLADRLMSPRLKGFSGTLVYPFAAATIELINIYTNPVGTWGATGFTQYGNMLIMQLASVTGMIGITFLMGWFASVVNWGWENRGGSKEINKGVKIFGAILTAVFVFGFLRLNLSSLNGTDGTIRVAGITHASQQELYEQAGGAAAFWSNPGSVTSKIAVQARWDAYLAETEREARAGAQVVFWNEIAGLTSNSDVAAMTAQAQEVAIQHGIYLAVPLAVVYPADMGKPYENTLLLIDPSGAIVLEHNKFGGALIESNRLVGNGKLNVATTPFGVLSAVICWDGDYPAIIRQTGQKGAGLLLDPSSDFIEIDPVHTYMAVFRAIENGMSLVRQTEFGLSMAVDPYGRVLAQTDFFGATDRTLVAQVPVKHVATIYSLFGSYLEWLAPIGLLLLIVRGLTARRQEN